MQKYTNESRASTAGDEGASALPPTNLALEQELLGCLLTHNDAIEEIPTFKWSHLYDPLHQSIFIAIERAVKARKTANSVTLAPEFTGVPDVDVDTTAVQYLGKLSAKGCARQLLHDYAQDIIDLAARRSLILTAEELDGDARSLAHGISALELIEETEQRLLKIAEDVAGERAAVIPFAEAAESAIKAVDLAFRDPSSGIRTGFIDLDAKLGRLQPSDLNVLAARPGMGKTALATNIAVNVARTGTPVAFFSLEMSAAQLAMRVLSQRIAVSSSKMRRGDVTEATIKAMMAAAEDLGELPIFTDDVGGATIAQVVSRARRMKRRHGIGLIVIDYLQLLQPSKRRENRTQDITEITTGLKALAKELNVPIIAISQLSRATETRENKRPQLSDLRESGSIEQDADLVMFVYREEYYEARKQPADITSMEYQTWLGDMAKVAGKAEVIIAKNRHGETSIVPLAFCGELTEFRNLAKEAR